ncbi:MAG: hypothetical protein FJ207_06795 [Gemmatimonadetes bacterium]|nr:hypothetical protein [Gemmatimonadota bacterium]
MTRGPFSPGTMILGGGAVLLMGFLLVGYLLPSDWEAEASAGLPVAPEIVFGFLDSPEGWQRWTPWPESGVQRSGPERGAGASLSWDDPEVGTGSFTIAAAAAPTRVEYTVAIDEGAIQAAGSVDVAADGGGSRVTWRERGDLGWNPLMGYWALSMGRAQSEEMGKGLERLRTLAVEAATDAGPADSLVAAGGPPVATSP